MHDDIDTESSDSLETILLLWDDIDGMCGVNKVLLASLRHTEALIAHKMALHHQWHPIMTEVSSFSLRQTAWLETANTRRNNTPPAPQLLNDTATRLRDELNICCKLDKYLLADTLLKKREGATFESLEKAVAIGFSCYDRDKARSLQESEPKNASAISTADKLLLLLFKTHRAAKQHPNKKLVIAIYDDKTTILDGLHTFCTRYPFLLPKNLTILLFHFDAIDFAHQHPEHGKEFTHFYTKKMLFDSSTTNERTYDCLEPQLFKTPIVSLHESRLDVSALLKRFIEKEKLPLTLSPEDELSDAARSAYSARLSERLETFAKSCLDTITQKASKIIQGPIQPIHQLQRLVQYILNATQLEPKLRLSIATYETARILNDHAEHLEKELAPERAHAFKQAKATIISLVLAVKLHIHEFIPAEETTFFNTLLTLATQIPLIQKQPPGAWTWLSNTLSYPPFAISYLQEQWRKDKCDISDYRGVAISSLIEYHSTILSAPILSSEAERNKIHAVLADIKDLQTSPFS